MTSIPIAIISHVIGLLRNGLRLLYVCYEMLYVCYMFFTKRCTFVTFRRHTFFLRLLQNALRLLYVCKVCYTFLRLLLFRSPAVTNVKQGNLRLLLPQGTFSFIYVYILLICIYTFSSFLIYIYI